MHAWNSPVFWWANGNVCTTLANITKGASCELQTFLQWNHKLKSGTERLHIFSLTSRLSPRPYFVYTLSLVLHGCSVCISDLSPTVTVVAYSTSSIHEHMSMQCTQWPGVPGKSWKSPLCPDGEGCLRFFIHSSSVWASCQRLAPVPHTTERTLFYGFSPVSCKAGGRGLLWISHAPFRKLPRVCHNSLLWRPPPSLNSPTLPSTPLLCLHH